MLTNEEILLKLGQQEDSFVERKSVNDLNDCLKTAVAFANSTPIGFPAIIFIGVKNNGDIESIPDLDKLQWSISDKISKAYPPIYNTTRILEKNGKKFLAILIPGSPERPHFAGQSFVREGTKSVVASESQFNTLVTQRNSKAYEILKWKGKYITITRVPKQQLLNGTTVPKHNDIWKGKVLDCNLFYVSLEAFQKHGTLALSIPLRLVDVNFDPKNDWLSIEYES